MKWDISQKIFGWKRFWENSLSTADAQSYVSENLLLNLLFTFATNQLNCLQMDLIINQPYSGISLELSVVSSAKYEGKQNNSIEMITTEYW